MRRPARRIATQQVLKITMNHLKNFTESASLCVLLGQKRVAQRDFDSSDANPGHARGDAKSRNPHAHACLEQGVTFLARNAGGQEHGVETGAETLLRL